MSINKSNATAAANRFLKATTDSADFAGVLPAHVGTAEFVESLWPALMQQAFAGEIISADSRQVYCGMDIGTGKDLSEYHGVPHHLIDIVPPTEEYNLSRFVADAARALCDITQRNRLPIVAGGSPLYVQALLRNYELPGGEPDAAFRASVEKEVTPALVKWLEQIDPELFRRTDTTQRKRVVRALEIAHTAGGITRQGAVPLPEFQRLVLAPYYTRKEIHERIEKRLRTRLEQGLLDEVRRLHDQGISWERLEYLGLEYRYAAQHLQGRLGYEDFFDRLYTQIRRFCKSQDGWFRKMEREGQDIYWLPQGNLSEASGLVRAFVKDEPLPCPEMRMSNIYYGPKSQ